MQTCTKCGKRSIPGLIRGAGKCQFHWNEGVWGAEWALKCEEDRAADDDDLAYAQSIIEKALVKA